MKEKVLEYLKSQYVGKTPTKIGLALGKDYNSASSSVNVPLKKTFGGKFNREIENRW